jgi:threonine synthase
MHAAEVFGSLEHALAEGLDHVEEMPSGPTPAISVGLNTSALQALNVLRESSGVGQSATSEEIIAMHKDLAALEGIYAEASSALALAAWPGLLERGAISPDETIVAVLTSSGLKDPETTAKHLAEIPLAEPTMDSLAATLRAAYGVDLVPAAVA